MSLFCISSLCHLHSITIHLYALIQRKLKPELTIPQFPWLCMSAIPGTNTSSCTLLSSPSTLYSFVEYPVLDDGGCLNALLLVDFIPSTLDHLFWDWNLESFFSALRLAVINGRFSRHRQFLGIHQCPLIDGSSQVFDLNKFIHTCYFALYYLDSHFRYRRVISHLLVVYINDR